MIYNDLQHHGIKGQKWGVRRFQNEDGSLTPAGEKNQQKSEERESNKQLIKDLNKKNNTLGKSITRGLLGLADPTQNYVRQRIMVKRAAKFVKEKNMSLEDALSDSRKVSRKNGALFIASAATLSIGLIAAGTIPIWKTVT